MELTIYWKKIMSKQIGLQLSIISANTGEIQQVTGAWENST